MSVSACPLQKVELRRQLGASRAEVVAMEEEVEKERRDAARLNREADALRAAAEAMGPSAALGPVLEALKRNREEAAAAAAAGGGGGAGAGGVPGSAVKGTPTRGRAALGAQTDTVGDYGTCPHAPHAPNAPLLASVCTPAARLHSTQYGSHELLNPAE